MRICEISVCWQDRNNHSKATQTLGQTDPWSPTESPEQNQKHTCKHFIYDEDGVSNQGGKAPLVINGNE